MNTKENQQKWVEECEKVLRLGGRSELTLINYRIGWNKFFKYYSNKTNLSKLKEEDLLDYFKKEFLDKNLASSTYNLHLYAIRLLYSVCFRKESNRTLLPSTKLQKRYPVIISKEEFIRIFNLEKNICHRCWLLLSFCCGLRSIDISLLKIEYIDSKNHKLKVLGKGNKERFTILPDIVIKFLRLYYIEYKFTNKTGYLFKGNGQNEHIHTRTVTQFFVKLKKKYDISKDITEHSLRHSFATYYLMNDGDLITLKEMLGHKSLDCTYIYIHMAQDFNNLKGINYDR